MSGCSSSIEDYRLDGAAGCIEVRLHKPVPAITLGGVVAVVCHPHPLYGGTMDNKVVTTLARCYCEQGIPVARFNFRGIGASGGAHDHGVGEVDDLIAVVNWLRRVYGAKRVLLAGFSFGAAVAAAGSYKVADLAHLVLVAPPVDRYTFDQSGQFPCRVCVIMGDQDELVAPEGVYHWLEAVTSPVDLVRMPEASHFFHGQLVRMRKELTRVLDKILAE